MSGNERYGLQEELRLSSPGDQRPLSWVAGAYYSNARVHTRYLYANQGDYLAGAFWGLTADQRYGLDPATGVTLGDYGSQGHLVAHMADNEIAGFGDASYWITDKLKLNAGIRFSRVELSYFQRDWGQFPQRGPYDPSSITQGVTTASPITPKFGLQYQFTPNDMAYFTAAKGFRAGGVNAQISGSFCVDGLRNAGITSTQIPPSYGPDTVWSYEAGGKFRLFDNRMQLNAAVYRIDWTGVQATVPLTCGYNFIMNSGKARSEGFDLQAQYRPVEPLTLGLNLGYTNARYLEGVAGPNPASGARPSINAGDGLGIPKWQLNANALYERRLTARITGYVRADLQYQGPYLQGSSYGAAPYNPFTRPVGANTQVNLRVGVRFGGLDLNLYANHLLNSRAEVGDAGNRRSNCAAGSVDCSIYGNFDPVVYQAFQPPMMLGMQVNYSF
jgi:outer membrane receptor protein involved in Fe transport